MNKKIDAYLKDLVLNRKYIMRRNKYTKHFKISNQTKILKTIHSKKPMKTKR